MGDVRIGTCAYDEGFRLAELSCDGLTLAVAKRHRAEAPDGYEFTLRAPRAIVREGFRDGPGVRRAWKGAIELARALDAALIVFTTPPTFRPTDEHVAALGRFFEWAHRGRIRLAWEPRGDAWTGALLWTLCREMAVSHAVDPLRRMCVRPRPPYFRLGGFRGHHDRYTDEQLRRVRNLCSAPLTYGVLGNASMAADARRLAKIADASVPPASAPVRSVKFESLADIVADVESFGDGPVRSAGPWTAAQTVRHVAEGIARSIDGDDTPETGPDPNVAWGDAVAGLRQVIERVPESAGENGGDAWKSFRCRIAERHLGFLEPG